MTMISATTKPAGRSRVLALLAGAAVLCAATATTATFDTADARGRSFSAGHRAATFDRNRFHHVGGHRYGSFYKCHGCRCSIYVGSYGVSRSRRTSGGGHHFEGM